MTPWVSEGPERSHPSRALPHSPELSLSTRFEPDSAHFWAISRASSRQSRCLTLRGRSGPQISRSQPFRSTSGACTPAARLRELWIRINKLSTPQSHRRVVQYVTESGGPRKTTFSLRSTKPSSCSRVDLLPIDRRLEAEVEVRERLDRRRRFAYCSTGPPSRELSREPCVLGQWPTFDPHDRGRGRCPGTCHRPLGTRPASSGARRT